MKSSKLMLAAIVSCIGTWLLLSTLFWMFSEGTFKECATSGSVGFIMLIFGWIPSVILCADLEKVLD
jgi:hypothetical protein